MLTASRLTSLRGGSLLLGPLDLTVSVGGCRVIMGPSGAGKSLLLRALADLDPSGGSVVVDGVERASLSAPLWRQRVAYVGATAGWWADTVGDHFAPAVRAAARARLPDLLLPEEALDWPVARASTGERQRLALLRAMTLPRPREQARVYLLDEPTAALDPEARDRVEALLLALLDARTALVVVSHDAEQARRLATEPVLTLRDGTLTAGIQP